MAKQSRPPIIAILGHVDHGKTSLLDYIRNTKVQAGEAGGITQHIGAYQAVHNGQALTFIDTPGHAAFSKMRSRGAGVTDIVVLVVAADDGVKPQTIESIQHIKKAQVPFVVAINKMDTVGASADMVKAQLTEHEVYVSGYGGDTEVVEVSAKTGQGVDSLLETLLTMGELLELKADPEGNLEGVIIESYKDPFLGSVGTVLVKEGTLHKKDTVWAENITGQVRTLLTAANLQVAQATPGMPVLVTGWNDVPAVGATVTAQQVEVEAQYQQTGPSLSDLLSNLEEQLKIRLIVKADVRGTLEAILQNIAGDNVEIVASGVGEVTESDVMMAETTGSRIVAFQVKVSSTMKKLAQRSGVSVSTYKIIYELIEDIQNQVLKMIEPTIDEKIVAKAELLKLFDIRGEQILGCLVHEGILRKSQKIHIRRGEHVVADAVIGSIKQGKVDVESVEAGADCGLVLTQKVEVEVGDQLEAVETLS